MALYKCFGEREPILIPASSEKQAIFLLALRKCEHISDSKARKREAGRLFSSMIQSYHAVREEDPSQLLLPL